VRLVSRDFVSIDEVALWFFNQSLCLVLYVSAFSSRSRDLHGFYFYLPMPIVLVNCSIDPIWDFSNMFSAGLEISIEVLVVAFAVKLDGRHKIYVFGAQLYSVPGEHLYVGFEVTSSILVFC
jgi:hypothetical protein